MFKGAILFDSSAILYTNAIYAVMMLIPLHCKETKVWQNIAKWYFLIVNSLAVILNLGDSVYFRFTGKRTTMSVMQEFENESNIFDVFLSETTAHWYLFLIGTIIIYLLCKLYVEPKSLQKFANYKKKIAYYIIQTLCFLLFIPLAIGGICTSYNYKQCEPICQPSNRSRSHTQHAILTHTNTWKTNF